VCGEELVATSGYFGEEWPDRRRFHLMANSTNGEEAVVETVLHAVALFR
jgi:hypothetical protein